MDLGVFRRKRSVFWAWLALPVLCVVVCHSAMHVICVGVENRLQRRQAVFGILEDVEQRMSVAKDIVCGFAMMGDGKASAASDLTSRISEQARRYGFMINSLQVNQSADDKEIESRALEIDLKGEGEILALMQFLNELQCPQHLTVVDSASLRLRQQKASGVSASYSADLTIRCFRDALQGGDDV